jgi:hypothetical protein
MKIQRKKGHSIPVAFVVNYNFGRFMHGGLVLEMPPLKKYKVDLRCQGEHSTMRQRIHRIVKGATMKDGVLVPSRGEVVLTLGGGMTVNGTTTHGGQQLFSVFEFINVVCEREGAYAPEQWRRLMRTNFVLDVRSMRGGAAPDLGEMTSVSFAHRRRREPILGSEAAMTVRGLARLLEVLDEAAGDVKEVVARVLTRCLHGASSAIEAVPERREKRKRAAIADASALMHTNATFIDA